MGRNATNVARYVEHYADAVGCVSVRCEYVPAASRYGSGEPSHYRVTMRTGNGLERKAVHRVLVYPRDRRFLSSDVSGPVAVPIVEDYYPQASAEEFMLQFVRTYATRRPGREME